MAIKEFFAGQTIFMTGGTGFVGKVLLEKILRSCPDVKKIYLAIRPKKDITIEERWKSVSSVPLFDRLKKENSEALKKVVLINADMKKPDLGISETDRKVLIDEVNIIYHVAATVQFADNVADTLIQNTRSTYLVAELGKSIRGLKVFVYASTTYSNFYRPESQWGEEIYPPVQDWRVLMKMLDTESLHLSFLHEKLLSGHPNPYTFSKSLAEQITSEYNQFYPTVIVRPSAVMSTVDEPIVGWVDSLNGMAALCIANALGILRVARHNDEAHHDYVPVDMVAKALIIATWVTYKNKPHEQTPVYNCTIGKALTCRTSEISKICKEYRFVEETPSKYIVWTRDLRLIENAYKYHIMFFFYQLLPACILDAGIYIYGAKPIFLSIAKKLAYASQRLFKDFAFCKVHFPNEKYVKLQELLEGEDEKAFGNKQFNNIEQISFPDEMRNCYLGILKYYFKEDLSKESVERNKKRYNRIKMLEKTTRVMFYSGLGWLAYSSIDVRLMLHYCGLSL